MTGTNEPRPLGPFEYSPQTGTPGHCMLAKVWDEAGNSVATIESTADARDATAIARLFAGSHELLEVAKLSLDTFRLHGDSELYPGLIKLIEQAIDTATAEDFPDAFEVTDTSTAVVAEQEHRDAPSGIPCVASQRWHADAPTKPGVYWFYGEPWMGQMGGHYTGTVKPETRLLAVRIQQLSNGLVAVIDGQFMPLQKWDGKRPGYLGKWAIAVLPDTNFKEATVVYP